MLASAVLASCLHAPPPAAPAGDSLIGMWRLVSVEVVRANGDRSTSHLGRKPTGIIVYDRSGIMAVQIAADPDGLGPDDRPVAGEPVGSDQRYLAYTAGYRLYPEAGTVVHEVRSASDPALLGHPITRSIKVDGDRLTLGVQWRLGTGEAAQTLLHWDRVDHLSR